jgi:hypothetical protein
VTRTLFPILVFPDVAMYQVRLELLPGFEWLSWRSFFLGLAESYGYGWYFTLVWVPIYNFASSGQVKRTAARSPAG